MKYILIAFTFYFTSIFSQSQKTLLLENEFQNSKKNENKIASAELSADVSKKNTGLAIIYSLLLPGMGELYAESYSSGKYFTIAEGVLWGTFIGINTYGSWQRDRYKSFAASNGGVNIDGKNDDYFATISEYENITQYNNEKALEHSFDEMLNDQRYYWNWENNDRRTYRGMWVSSEHAFNNVRFIVGALIVNRIVSAINAVRLVAAYNKRQSQEAGWNFSIGTTKNINLPTGLEFNFQTSF
jgi:hypothetical protein